ncbi:Protein N-acetyltransferase, RimJ/RimL family [Micromonospora haikouensis]|uniref:Protein N-acetyltransferase, RimJ/RimL family n=1 Tax=Micromonospora haikouensis TaxID=686309 RepID=A0A1C4XI71_9ACTN|nr:GNAT family N-acetyltransferase [Micromonospora haikouensis]SCF07861.1 Protein N-acetyltransferase, RimJ/RimL family [Micromonospora haikouensis]
MELTTGRIGLTPLDLDRDLADLHVAYADPLVMARWLHEPASTSPDETRRRLASRSNLPGARLWSVRRAGHTSALGLVELIGSTAPPGMSWMLRQDAWRQGLMGEAVAAVVAHLLGPGGLDLVEAWADATNTASLAVARRGGFTERGRFAARHPDGRRHETVVLGRRRIEDPTDLYAAEVVLPVRDVAGTLDFLHRAFDCTTAFRHGEPLQRAGVRLGPWSSSRGLQLALAPPDSRIDPATVYLHGGAPAELLRERCLAAGGSVPDPIRDQPWGRFEFSVQLPEGHRLVIGTPV